MNVVVAAVISSYFASGGLVDGPQNGTPPPPWAIPIQSTGFFKTETLCAEVKYS